MLPVGSVHEVKTLDLFPIEAGSCYIMDKGYIDFGRLHRIHKEKVFFATRAKDNFKFVRLSSRTVDKTSGIKCDQTARLKNHEVSLAYPDVIGRLKYYDSDRLCCMNNTLMRQRKIDAWVGA